MKEQSEHSAAWKSLGGWILVVCASVVATVGVIVALAAWRGITRALEVMQ